MKKEHFKADQFKHDPKKVKNEPKPNNSEFKHDDDDTQDEEVEFKKTLTKHSRQDDDANQRG